ncbi:MAG: hypothetical protein A3F74_14405 [Betaproteobacteria bacterium RIFCSPLOWO2_12_FULL_62_58]|nr:MAG: hypothetical protein A3F74_14405 [Betaproteobacteria bacterium RIFCSPLOWO2_12_FULL_62_58]
MIEKPHLARSRRIEPAENVQERGLAAARRSEQHDELTRTDPEIHAAQRVHLGRAHTVDLGEAARHKDGGGFSVAGRSFQ